MGKIVLVLSGTEPFCVFVTAVAICLGDSHDQLRLTEPVDIDGTMTDVVPASRCYPFDEHTFAFVNGLVTSALDKLGAVKDFLNTLQPIEIKFAALENLPLEVRH